MPPYATSNSKSLALNSAPPSALWPGDELYLFGTFPYIPGNPQKATDANVVAEAVAVNERSVAVQLVPRPGGGAAPGVHVQVIATGNPGAAEIDVQDADMDADGAYITQTTSTAYKMTVWTQIGGTNFWISTTQLQPEGGRFVSLLCVANPNAVPMTAKIAYV